MKRFLLFLSMLAGNQLSAGDHGDESVMRYCGTNPAVETPESIMYWEHLKDNRDVALHKLYQEVKRIINSNPNQRNLMNKVIA